MHYREERGKSYICIGEIYFWTVTINNRMKLLMNDQYKDIIISSWDSRVVKLLGGLPINMY
ncbi:MAG: hypothetical protein QM763_09965 [Agriterribacter sp.]